MQAREIRLWATEEIRERLDDAYRELFALRRELAMGRLEDYNRVKAVKQDIARMRTILRERELVTELVEEAA
jgi:large subunit ribosomal protein L29